MTSCLGGAAFLIGGWLQQAGLETATVTNTGFLTALYVIITPLIVLCWSGKMPNVLVWPAVVLSALGTWLLGGGTLGAFSRGDIMVAISAFLPRAIAAPLALRRCSSPWSPSWPAWPPWLSSR